MRISDWSSDVCSSDLFPVEAAFMPCMMHGLVRKRGIVVVGGMERFKSRHLDIVVAGVVIGLRSADANGCVDAREHHFKLNEIGRAHVCTPVTNAHLVCRLLL